MRTDGGDDLFQRDADTFCSRLNNADVGLMRDQPIDLVDAHAGRVEHLAGDIAEHPHRKLEDRLTVHAQEWIAQHLARGDRPRDGQNLMVRAVRMQCRREHAGLFGGFEHDSACAIAEQHTGTAIAPVENAREHLGADHQRTLMTAGADEFFGDRQGIRKTAAHRLHVECRTIVTDAQARLEQRRSTREDEVRRRGRDDDQVDIIARHAGRFDRAP